MAKRNAWQMRLTEEDEKLFDELEAAYGLDRTNLVRHMLQHVSNTRPTFQIVPAGKELALVGRMN